MSDEGPVALRGPVGVLPPVAPMPVLSRLLVFLPCLFCRLCLSAFCGRSALLASLASVSGPVPSSCLSSLSDLPRLLVSLLVCVSACVSVCIYFSLTVSALHVIYVCMFTSALLFLCVQFTSLFMITCTSLLFYLRQNQNLSILTATFGGHFLCYFF